MNQEIRIALTVLSVAFLCLPGFGTAQDQRDLFRANSGENLTEALPRQPMSDDDLARLRQQEALMNFDAETSLDRGASIHPRLMETVRDNTLGVRYEEREAYLRILRLAQEVPVERQERFATELRESRRLALPTYRDRNIDDFPQFVDLFTNPDAYRGRPVTIRGVMRKLTKFEVGKNSVDLDQAYEGWVFTADSQSNPVVVVFTSKDERLPVQGDMQEEVRFTGYVFKQYGYDAVDTLRKAPLIIAGEVEYLPRPPLWMSQIWSPGWYLFTLLAFLIGCFLIWQVNRREMPPRPYLQVEPDFNHFPPREHPATDPFLVHSISETEDA